MFIEKLAVVQSDMGQAAKLRNMAFVTLKCLGELANVRLTIFEDKPTKFQFAANFAKNLMESFGNLA